MDNVQKAKLSSYNLIYGLGETYKDVIELVPLFAKGMVNLKVKIDDINQFSILQNKDLKGVTKTKNNYLAQSKSLLLEVAGAVKSHAKEKGDKALESLVDYPKSKINALDQRDTIIACRAVLAEARKLTKEELALVGQTTEDLDSFEEVVDGLDGRVDSRKAAGIDQTSVTKHIADLFDQAQEIKVDILDKLAPQFQRKAPEFYEKYKAAAVINYKHNTKKDDKGTEEVKA